MQIANEEFSEIKNRLIALKDVDISQNELGTANGFHEAEDYKNRICRYLESIIDKSLNFSNVVNHSVLQRKLSQIPSWIKSLQQNIQKVDSLVDSGVHDQNFPKQRQNTIDAIKKLFEDIRLNLHALEIDMKVSEVESKVTDDSYFDSKRSEIESLLADAQKNTSQIEKVLNAVQDKTVKEQVEQSSGQFGDLVEHHKGYETRWFLASVIAALLLSVVVIYIVFFIPSIPSYGEETSSFIVDFIKKIILLSLTGLLFKIALSKYNTERGLRLIYEHRQKVLDQYLSFEAGIGDDTDAKNQFRLEIAKYIFSDPQSNYSSHTGKPESEININPVLTTVDSLSKNR